MQQIHENHLTEKNVLHEVQKEVKIISQPIPFGPEAIRNVVIEATPAAIERVCYEMFQLQGQFK